jgi:hypothetical protein
MTGCATKSPLALDGARLIRPTDSHPTIDPAPAVPDIGWFHVTSSGNVTDDIRQFLN